MSGDSTSVRLKKGGVVRESGDSTVARLKEGSGVLLVAVSTAAVVTVPDWSVTVHTGGVRALVEGRDDLSDW